MTTYEDDHHFFSGLKSWDYVKWITILLNILMTITGTILSLGVIWYERHSADIRYRTLMNQMLSHICFIHIARCQFYQHFMSAFAPISLCKKSLTYTLSTKKATQITFVQKKSAIKLNTGVNFPSACGQLFRFKVIGANFLNFQFKFLFFGKKRK
jgi:hypothetical protein